MGFFNDVHHSHPFTKDFSCDHQLFLRPGMDWRNSQSRGPRTPRTWKKKPTVETGWICLWSPTWFFFQVSGVLQDGGGHRLTHDSTHPKLVGSERSEFGDWPITWAKKGDRSVFFGCVKPHVKTIKKIQRRVAPSQFPLAQWHRIWGVFWATEMGGALWISWLHWEWPVLWRPEGRCHFKAVKKDRSLIWQRKTPCKNH